MTLSAASVLSPVAGHHLTVLLHQPSNSPDYLIPHLLSLVGPRCHVVSVGEARSHFTAVMRRAGVPADTITCAAANLTSDTCLAVQLEELVRQAVAPSSDNGGGDAPKPLDLLLLSDLTVLFLLGVSLNQIQRLVLSIIRLTENAGVRLCISLVPAVSADAVSLADWLTSLAGITISSELLPTGQSREVSGKLSLRDVDTSTQYHYKLQDRGAVFYPIGLTPNVV